MLSDRCAWLSVEQRFERCAPLPISVPPGNFVCECCGLFYEIQRPVSANIEARMHQPNTPPKRCARCAPHRQADDDASLVLLANDHMQWYWEFAELKDAEAKSAAAEVDEIRVQIGDARERMIAAFRSRDNYIRALARISDEHEPVRGGCSCRRHDCPTLALVDQPWIRSRVNDLRSEEDGGGPRWGTA